jgi:hypothetical protein
MTQPTLTESTDLALLSMLGHPAYRLSLVNRAQIWLAMEPDDADGVKVRLGYRRRVKLATLCTQKIIKLWEDALPDNRLPHKLLSWARECVEGKLDPEAVRDKQNEAWAILESLLYSDQIKWAMGAGFAAAATVGVALSDENFDAEADESNDGDRAVDLYDWDAAIFASLAYSREAYVDEPMSRLLRKDFWEWYLKEAVPAAYQSPI